MALKQKQVLNRQLQLAPQQLIEQRLLQLSGVGLQEHIQREIEENPALEEEIEQKDEQTQSTEEIPTLYTVNSDGEYEETSPQKEHSPETGYIDAIPAHRNQSLYNLLKEQIPQLSLEKEDAEIADLIIGCIDENGYFASEIADIANYLSFSNNVHIAESHIEKILKKVQQLEPAGIAARNVQESLLIQINKKHGGENDATKEIAHKIVSTHLDLIVKNKIKPLQEKLSIKTEKVKEALQFISKLNASPGDAILRKTEEPQIRITPDFTVANEGESLHISIHNRYIPKLRINQQFFDMKEVLPQQKSEVNVFVSQRIKKASFLLEALKMRQETLSRLIRAIVDIQKAYFTSGDELAIVPMLLEDVAKKIKRDISTISRSITGKYVATDWEIKPLRFFFNQQMKNDLSNTKTSLHLQREIGEIVEKESVQNPYTDQQIADLLEEKGYHVSRRTILTYRNKMGIPTSHKRTDSI